MRKAQEAFLARDNGTAAVTTGHPRWLFVVRVWHLSCSVQGNVQLKGVHPPLGSHFGAGATQNL